MQARIIENPPGITAKLGAPGFVVEEFRHVRALTKELAKTQQSHTV